MLRIQSNTQAKPSDLPFCIRSHCSELKEKFHNIELSNSPDNDYYEDMVTKASDLDTIDLDKIEKLTKEMEEESLPKEDTVDMIKQLIKKEKMNDKK